MAKVKKICGKEDITVFFNIIFLIYVVKYIEISKTVTKHHSVNIYSCTTSYKQTIKAVVSSTWTKKGIGHIPTRCRQPGKFSQISRYIMLFWTRM